MISIKELTMQRSRAEIDLAALRHNYNEIRRALKPGTKLCCVIKANAYGHGAVRLAREFEKLGADFFAVSCIEEAMELRDAGVSTPMLILGYTPIAAVELLASRNISQCVYSPEYASELSSAAVSAGVNIKIHIKFDTGMSRIGFRDASKARAAALLPGLVPEGGFTHFASADEGQNGAEFTALQYERFMKFIEDCGVDFAIRHCCNSAGICDYPQYQLDMCRAGIILMGLQPSLELANPLNLIPVMSLKSVISMVKDLDAGNVVSYGRTFTAPRNMKCATVPIGYADGYLRRNAEGGAKVLVNGVLCPILGRICMDQLLIDASALPGLKAGPENDVELFGKNITATELAAKSKTINYEITCGVSPRIPRVYINEL